MVKSVSQSDLPHDYHDVRYGGTRNTETLNNTPVVEGERKDLRGLGVSDAIGFDQGKKSQLDCLHRKAVGWTKWPSTNRPIRSDILS